MAHNDQNNDNSSSDDDEKKSDDSHNIISFDAFRNRNDSADDDLTDENLKDAPQKAKRKPFQWARNLRPSNQNKPPIFNVPPLTKAVTYLLLLVFLVQYFGPMWLDYWLTHNFGFIPARFSGLAEFKLWTALTPITHSFLHGSWFHFGLNVLMLVAFGAGLERALGWRHFLLIYVLGAFAGVLAQFILDPGSRSIMIGASGAISAFFGAILIVLQRSGSLGMGASLKPFIVLWVVISILFGFMGGPDGSNIAWAAHLGGFFIGLAYFKLMRL